MTGHMVSSTELCSTYPGRIEDILKMGARVGVCIVINIKSLLIDHSWRLVRYRPLFVDIKRRTVTVDDASKYQWVFVPAQFLMHLPVVIKLITPVLSFALYSVASCTLLNFFQPTICMKYLLLDVILIIKQLKPHEYENSSKYPTYDISVFKGKQFKLNK